MHRRHEISDENWVRIRLLLPAQPGDPGVTVSEEDNRLFINAVFWIAKTGAPWRDLPERFGNWNSVFQRFNRWAQKGVWQRIFEALGSEADLEWLLLDSTTVRAHQHAAGKKGVKTEKPSDEAEEDLAPKPTSRSMPWEIR
jgi:transposase